MTSLTSLLVLTGNKSKVLTDLKLLENLMKSIHVMKKRPLDLVTYFKLRICDGDLNQVLSAPDDKKLPHPSDVFFAIPGN